MKFKHYDSRELFLQPEKPFMLIYTDKEGHLCIAWLESEYELLEAVKGIKYYGGIVREAIEIGSCRDVVLEE